MVAVAEEERRRREMQSWRNEVDRLSQEMRQGSLRAFGELAAIMIGEEQDGQPARYNFRELIGILDEKSLATMYGVYHVCKDLRDNFGGDNIGFPPEATPIVQEIGTSLGGFIQQGVFGQDLVEDPLDLLGKAIKGFDKLIRVTEEEANKPGPYNNWYKF